MSIGKLKAPVGDPKATREIGKLPAKNNASDVVALRELLTVNGYGKPSTSGKVDATLLKCIKLAEIHMGGGRDKDQVIDPDDTVYKKLVSGYKAKMRKEKEKVFKIVVGNKTVYVDEKQYETVKADILIRLNKLAKSFRSQQKFNHDVWKEYNDVARLEKGLVKASIHAASSMLGGATSINHKIITIQSAHIASFETAVAAKDLAKITQTLPKAEKATRDAYVEVQRFLSAFIRGAGRGETAMVITSSSGFIIVGAMAGPILVTGASLSAAQASVAAGTGVAFLQSSSNELGRKISGEKITAWGSAKTIMVDTIVGGLTAGIGAKLPVKFMDDVAKAMVSKVTKVLPSLSKTAAETLIRKYLAGGAAEMTKEACAQATKICGDMVKSGKAPTSKDFEAAFIEVIFKGMTAGILRSFSKFETKIAVKTKEVLSKEMVPRALSKYVSSDVMSKLNRARIIKEVLTKFNENMSKITFSKVVTTTKSDAALGDMLKKAGDYMKADPTLQQKVDASVREILKNEGVIA
ncbi:MAG: hypothetical protein WA782_10810 [Sulfitobacter sp.]